MTDTVKKEKGLFTNIIEAPMIALGLSDETPTKSHVFWGILEGLVAGYILGVMRGKSNPNSNVLGF